MPIYKEFNPKHYDLLIALSNTEDSVEIEIFHKQIKNTKLLLEGADLSGRKIPWVDMSKAILRDANFTNANLTGVDFTNADLKGATFRDARLVNARFEGTNVKDTDFKNVDFEESEFWDINLHEADYRGAKFPKAYFGDIDIQSLHLKGVNLRRANFSEVYLVGANFNEADLSFVNFSNQDLTNAQFQRAHLYRADLSDVNLRGAKMNGAELTEADLRSADLLGADLTGAHLADANLNGANFTKANLQNVDLTSSKLIGTILNGADITGAKLYGSSQEDWVINGIVCKYVYFDIDGIIRTPSGRNFSKKEFEDLYKNLPKITYYFEEEFKPLTPIVMNKVVNSINQKYPQFGLKLDSFHARGTPHAVFTILLEKYADNAVKEIEKGYQKTIHSLEGEVTALERVVSKLIDQPKQIQHAETIINAKRIDHTKHSFGDLKGGRDINIATDHGTAIIIDKT